MRPESIELSFLSLFSFATFFIFLLTSKYSYLINNGVLLDKDFDKPQAFHTQAIARCGGMASFFSLTILFLFYYLLFSEIIYEYIFVGTSLFIIGFFDDLKINISPNKRLFLMIIFLTILISFLPIKIQSIDLIFLNSLLDSKVFSTIFILLCFLFIINGANLIDGFNGLLSINLIIINCALLYININGNHIEFSFLIAAQIIILIVFLLFNFPNAKIFFGDSGSYLFGSLIALNTVITNNLNPNISSFFFCILLFYLFYEVFFSFIRKVYQNKSPVFPDREHLHMLFFYKISKKVDSLKGNYLTSVFVNILFSILVLPSIFFAENGLICRLWFFSLTIIYTIIYFRLYRLIKN